MLNKPLYSVLKARYGRVSVTNENIRRVETGSGDSRTVQCRGENYQMNCPLCGDTKGRLSVSYLWLEKPPISNRRRTELAHCYNEQCPVCESAFWEPIAQEVDMAKMGFLLDPVSSDVVEQAVRVQVKARLPEGFTPLKALPATHPAISFIKKQYNGSFDPAYLSDVYGVGFTDIVDLIYPLAQHRIVYPIHAGGQLVAWQGRTILDGVKPRWWLPVGFVKPIYNADNVLPTDTVVIAEGIPAAIACGRTGVAVFGKSLTQEQVGRITATWSSVLIATDPDTFVPDNRQGGRGVVSAVEMKKRLDKVLKIPCQLLKWPEQILEAARKHNNGEDIQVPDPADLGMERMSRLIERSTHAVDRSTQAKLK